MSGKVYVAIEHHGPGKECQLQSVYTYGPQFLVVLNRGEAPAIYLSGDGRVLSEWLDVIKRTLQDMGLYQHQHPVPGQDAEPAKVSRL